MTAFAAALEVLATDANLSVAGTYAPLDGVPVAVRLIGPGRGTTTATLFETGVSANGVLTDLPKTYVAVRPTDTARLTITEGEFVGTYVILKATEDVEKLSWKLELAPA
jgi:hypothetical protein